MNQRIRDIAYLVAFLLIAGVLLFLGADLFRRSMLLPWLITFSATTVVAVLGISLYRFKLKLDESRNELMRAEAELNFARKVQQALFPKRLPSGDGLEFSAVCIPARGIGGDYYDVHRLEDGRLMIAVADISGKGIPAAILMANLQALLRVVAHTTASPSEICRRLNHHLHEVTDASRYATLFYGEWLEGERRLRYVNAGHNSPLLLSDSSCRLLNEGGIPLGVFHESEYAMGEADLASGDLLVMYSDGITEAGQREGREFGEQRLRALVQANRHRPLAELQAVILNEVQRWTGGEPDDDVTLMMIRVVPQHPPSGESD